MILLQLFGISCFCLLAMIFFPYKWFQRPEKPRQPMGILLAPRPDVGVYSIKGRTAPRLLEKDDDSMKRQDKVPAAHLEALTTATTECRDAIMLKVRELREKGHPVAAVLQGGLEAVMRWGALHRVDRRWFTGILSKFYPRYRAQYAELVRLREEQLKNEAGTETEEKQGG